VRYDHDQFGVRAVDRYQTTTGGLALDDGQRRSSHHPIEDVSLMRGRVGQHRVQYRDEGHSHGLDQLEHVLPVGPAEQSVLVLEHHRIRRLDGRDRPMKRGAVAGDPLGDDLLVWVGFGAIHYPDDYGAPTRLGSGDRRR
jgi:hypothetical protein